jgi:transcriptional regulator with XRE-family HTH domain
LQTAIDPVAKMLSSTATRIAIGRIARAVSMIGAESLWNMPSGSLATPHVWPNRYRYLLFISNNLWPANADPRTAVAEVAFAMRFRQGRERKKLTQAEVATALGVSQSAVAQWEAGRSFPQPAMAAKIAKLIGVQFLAEERARPQNRGPVAERARLPIIGLPAPGDNERILVDDQSHGEIVAPPQLEGVAEARAVYVRGRSMEPRYYPGEIVYLHPLRPPNPGDFVFLTVREPGFAAAVGYIRQYVGQDLVHIRSLALNPKHEHLVAKEDLVGMATIVGSGLF